MVIYLQNYIVDRNMTRMQPVGNQLRKLDLFKKRCYGLTQTDCQHVGTYRFRVLHAQPVGDQLAASATVDEYEKSKCNHQAITNLTQP